jgi:hypothetical protein
MLGGVKRGSKHDPTIGGGGTVNEQLNLTTDRRPSCNAWMHDCWQVLWKFHKTQGEMQGGRRAGLGLAAPEKDRVGLVAQFIRRVAAFGGSLRMTSGRNDLPVLRTRVTLSERSC